MSFGDAMLMIIAAGVVTLVYYAYECNEELRKIRKIQERKLKKNNEKIERVM